MPPLVRRKSVTPIDRAPNVVNRPSSSPVRLMVRPHSAASKTIGENARQYSSFTHDGFFPLSLDANKAPRGKNDIDKELLIVQRKLLRAQSASVRNVEHDALEEELNRVIRLPLADFLKVPPTVDPHSLASTITSSRSMSPLLQNTNNAEAALQDVFLSSRSAGDGSMQQQQVVPNTTCGSRPTTPSVYIGGRVSVAKAVTMQQQQLYPTTSPASRPTSAATDPVAFSVSRAQLPASRAAGALSASSTLNASAQLANNGNGGSRLGGRSAGMRLVGEEEGPFASSQKQSQRPSAGHLVFMVRGTSALPPQQAATLGRQWQNADVPQWARGLHPSLAPPPSKFAAAHGLPGAAAAGASRADDDVTNADGTLDGASVRRGDMSSMAAGGDHDGPHLKQRHQTQTCKQQGFNISTSSISHEADPLEVQMNALLRSRPMSAPSGGAVRHPAAVYPLRAVFLH